MKETPLLFKAEMVKALLAGMKTQTRRIIKPQPTGWKQCQNFFEPYYWAWCVKNDQDWSQERKCPYGWIGDHIWVKETWQPHPEAGSKDDDIFIPSNAIVYAADLSAEDFKLSRPWKSSMFMPRVASRIMLEIIDIRVQCVQKISESDAIAEGLQIDNEGYYFVDTRAPQDRHYGKSAKKVYSVLWDEINFGRGYGWDFNPWVWVIEFKLMEKI